MTDLPKVYSPKEVEEKWYRFWEEKRYFTPKRDPAGKPYTIVIPPPNVTGILHMGHALNNTLQDILIRWKRMEGHPTLWVPGTDHAGIATQNVVEKALAKEGRSRHDLGREKFVERVWKWREEYGGTIIRQLKRLGASCDWSRTRFTMDEGLSRAVQEVFIRLYEKGLIYRGHYIINWCPRCQTALSDEEAPQQEVQGYLYYIRYPLDPSTPRPVDPSYIVVATTRPETLLGDTGVAVHPKDERYRRLLGKTVLLPVLKRRLHVIEDEFVNPEFGTGIVKVTPAHDPNDFLMGQKHKLPSVNVMNADGTMNEEAGPYRGLDRFECRKRILVQLEKEGLLEKTEKHLHAVGHCYRCHTVVEPRLSLQWFVKMKPLAEPAIRVVEEGKVVFYPSRWTKIYLDWMHNIRDWCISRQIWWGHRIPVWYCVGDDRCTLKCKEPIVRRTPPEKCPHCGSKNLRQDEDVLDTWFSSWLWPFSTLGWPDQTEDLRSFYPTNTLVTAPEILFFWVARMIMAGLEFCGKEPFHEVYIHGTVRTEGGKKMSKSLGNIIDPLDVIEHVGADALRFSLMVITATGSDVYLSEQKFLIGRNFGNKIWNAARLILPKLSEKRQLLSPHLPLDDTDRWILSRLNRTIEWVTEALEEYSFNDAGSILYEFFWHEFCDWYLEMIKTRRNEEVAPILEEVLTKSLLLLHPFMPFITEEIWQYFSPKTSIVVSPWPKPDGKYTDSEAEEKFSFLMKVATSVRNLKDQLNIPHGIHLETFIPSIKTIPGMDRKFFGRLIPFLRKHIGIMEIHDVPISFDKPHQSATLVVDHYPVYVKLGGIIDVGAEKVRIQKEIEKKRQIREKTMERLNDQHFLSRAPEEVVEKTKESVRLLEEGIAKLEEALAELGA